MRRPVAPPTFRGFGAELPGLVYSVGEGELRIEQYVGSRVGIGKGLSLHIESSLPWTGHVRIEFVGTEPLKLSLRVPGWANRATATIEDLSLHEGSFSRDALPSRRVERETAPIFGRERFERADYLTLDLNAGKVFVDLDMAMEISLLRAPREVRSDRGLVAVTRGPLVYCAESADNPDLDFNSLDLDIDSLSYSWDPALFGRGCGTILAKTVAGRPLKLLPYCYWGNRGKGSMRVWFAGDRARALL